MPKNLVQNFVVKSKPREVYEALMTSKLHAKIVQDRADIKPVVGYKFKIYGGSIEGENLALEKNKRIVQSWRYEDWPEGHYSIAIWNLSLNGKNTKVQFIQISVPDSKAKDIGQGWWNYYWAPLKAMLEK